MGDPGDTKKPFELSFWKFLAPKLCVLVGEDPVVHAVPCCVQRLPCFEKELAARQFTSTAKKECIWQSLACCYAVLRQNASILFALQTSTVTTEHGRTWTHHETIRTTFLNVSSAQALRAIWGRPYFTRCASWCRITSNLPQEEARYPALYVNSCERKHA
jgi:hypothetical protein